MVTTVLLLGATTRPQPPDDSGGLLSEVAGLLLGTPEQPPPPPPSSSTTPPPTHTPPPQTSSPPTSSAPTTEPPPSTPPQPPPPAAPPDQDRGLLDTALSLLGPLLSGSPLPIVLPGEEPSVEPGPARVWTLTSSELTLRGIHYRGHAEREVRGRQVTTLHFTIDKARIDDLVLRGALGNGRNLLLRAGPDGQSEVDEFDIYIVELVGTLTIAGLPLVRVRLNPQTLPDIDLGLIGIPELTFRDAVLRNTDLIDQRLFIPRPEITLVEPCSATPIGQPGCQPGPR
ncbi:hypothetical protein [Saccharopolyspora sp. NPDC049357]|uniref:hypothetical protein n=1 Tax=Saccharopolyspora sp. NPDC049357 TaxID=3154507 RepID=UPI003419050A